MISPFFLQLNEIDETIAIKFGRFPVLFRGGLAPSRRRIIILEIGKLEGLLGKNLINLNTWQRTINLISREIVQVFYMQYKGGGFSNPTLDEDDTFLPAKYL